jgi:ribosomal protein L44E
MLRSVATRCSECGHFDQDGHVYKVGFEDATPSLSEMCPSCKKYGTVTVADQSGPSFASTPYAWGDTKWDRYDYGLGVHTTSKKHRDQVMKSLGCVEGFRSER